MLKVAVLGAGHLGKIHLKLLQQSNLYELVGFYDFDKTRAKAIEEEFGYPYFEQVDELMDKASVIDIVTPTISHFKAAKEAIEKGKHVFIEKPITQNSEEARTLTHLLKKHKVKGQVGHVERFNPAFKAANEFIKEVKFVEAHRLAEFNPRGTDVPVVLDLMIHDIDIILNVVKSPIKNIHANGVSVISKTPDIANARIEFENGCIANLTASRISLKNMRKTRFFQKDAYISVDFFEKSCEIVKMRDAPENPGDFDMILKNAEGEKKQIYFDKPKIIENNAILDELESFAQAIMTDNNPQVTLEQGAEALSVAEKILEKI